MKSEKKIYSFLGLPGSGKGTQAELLAKKIGAEIVSIGDLIRNEIASCDLSDPFCKDIKERYTKGVPQPDDIVIDIVSKHISTRKNNIIFDNFPFSKEQAEKYFLLCRKLIEKKPILILIEVSEKTAVNRIIHRKICSLCNQIYIGSEESICEKCGGALIVRSDDNIEVVKNRIKLYKPRLSEVEEVFQKEGTVYKIDGEPTIKKVERGVDNMVFK